MTTNTQVVVSIVMLGGFLWAAFVLLPKARREDDKFALTCSLLVALIALFGFLFIGVGTR